jgi:uncharacterized membrane protein
MKKFVRILCLALVAVMLCATLASCAGVKAGKYRFGDTVVTKSYTDYTFKGSNVTVDVYVAGVKVTDQSFEAKYKVKDGEITFTWEDADGKEQTSTQTFVENDDGSIKIGALTFKPVEE